MKLIVLGAAAGGGLPQWNCGCRNCADARAGVIPRMTQSSVAVSVDGEAWVVLNASPDIRAQVDACAAMHPPALRGSPIASVVLTNGDIDHIAGLLTLREKTGFDIYATAAGLDILRSNSVFGVLDPSLVAQHRIALDVPFEAVPGLTVTPFAVPGKVALFLEGDSLNLEEVGEQTVGLLLEDGTSRAAYVPGCAAIPDWLLDRLGGVDLLLFDGTVWNNDDMQRTGTGEKTGARMGHVPLNGELGSLDRLADVEGRKVFIHINNTNPILQPDSVERAEVLAKGWDVAFDGMEIAL
ncbi:pyrroloquinoline quinone biosynthesis protein PqqB [Tateyamaria omphalii]|uniref:pyrroloquinoline quinone biosynthesis protein PqqB n=1 Tax=Tateyamaria omphalii TaxID=299262 RepID=UPI001C99F956|nr:pyrroloquinoline quinone biosynthesis protein PqqB [Tateyamaria omphalii]MBY5935700.1 pyrroloquinoline quinone biosynthesis protein PqqB [Tateyamaria omphalii]